MGNVSWKEKGCFSDLFNVLVRREVLIRDDTKVMDVGESEHSGAVNLQLLCTV